MRHLALVPLLIGLLSCCPGEATASTEALWTMPIHDIRTEPGPGAFGFFPPTPVVLPDGTCYVGTNRGELLAYRPGGILDWTIDLGRVSVSNEPTIGADGMLLLTNERDRRLLKLDRKGHVIYKIDLPERAVTTPKGAADGWTYVGIRTGIQAVKPDGSLGWFARNQLDYLDCMLRPDGNIIHLSVSKHATVLPRLAVWSRTGERLFSRAYRDRTKSMPAAAPDGRTVITEGPFVKVLDGRGQTVRSIDLKTTLAEACVSPSGLIVVASDQGDLHALTLDGQRLWTARLPFVADRFRTFDRHENVYFSSSEGILTCVDRKGSVRWVRNLKGSYPASVTVAPDGTVYANADSHRVWVIDGSGQVLDTLTGEGLSLSNCTTESGAAGLADFDRVTLLRVGPGRR